MLHGKAIVITGGTGSFGKKMVQVILEEYKPGKLIIFGRDELKQFEM
jgi:UDP-N-acetylglucosamine 4,6-dehydratase